jgi:hypothetical protein
MLSKWAKAAGGERARRRRRVRTDVTGQMRGRGAAGWTGGCRRGEGGRWETSCRYVADENADNAERADATSRTEDGLCRASRCAHAAPRMERRTLPAQMSARGVAGGKAALRDELSLRRGRKCGQRRAGGRYVAHEKQALQDEQVRGRGGVGRQAGGGTRAVVVLPRTDLAGGGDWFGRASGQIPGPGPRRERRSGPRRTRERTGLIMVWSQAVGQVRHFWYERLGVGPRWPW